MDAFYDKVKLLLPMKGADNGVVFDDFSVSNVAVTPVGGAKTVTAASKYYGAAAAFNGTSDYLPLAGSSYWDIGTGDFAIDAWVRLNSTAGFQSVFARQAVGSSALALQFRINSGRAEAVLRGGSTTVYTATGTTVLSTGVFHHLRVSRVSGTLRVFAGGILEASVAGATANLLDATAQPTIGVLKVGTDPLVYWLNGYLNDVRVVIGAGLDTTDFTPPPRMVGQVSGTVRDAAGAGASRKIVAFSRAVPTRGFAAQSDAAGAYNLWVPSLEVSRVVFDDDAGTLYNDLIDRVIAA